MYQTVGQITSSSKKNKQSLLLDIVEEPINKDDYEIIRNTFGLNEYIPSKNIPIVMKHHFGSSELILSYNENHGIYKIKIGDFFREIV